MDDAVGGAVSVWCEGGGIGGSGASEIREGTASDIDIGEDEIAGRLCEGEGYGSCFAALRVETSEESAILGRMVSTERVTVLLDSDPSWLLLPDESENLSLSTWMTPLVVLSVSGVKVAE